MGEIRIRMLHLVLLLSAAIGDSLTVQLTGFERSRTKQTYFDWGIKVNKSVGLRLRGGSAASIADLPEGSNTEDRQPRKRQPPKPKQRDIIVPDQFRDVLSAVVAAEDGASIYVRQGVYHWSEEETGNETRADDHDFGRRNDAACGRAFVAARITVRGDVGAALWGRWVLLNGSSGRVRDVALAYDMREPMVGQATLLVIGRDWSVRECDVRAALGTAVALWGRGELDLVCSGVGGVETGASAQAAMGVWCLGQSELRCVGSTLAAARSPLRPLQAHARILCIKTWAGRLAAARHGAAAAAL